MNMGGGGGAGVVGGGGGARVVGGGGGGGSVVPKSTSIQSPPSLSQFVIISVRRNKNNEITWHTLPHSLQICHCHS